MDENLKITDPVTLARGIWENLKAGNHDGYISPEIATQKMRSLLEGAGRNITELAAPDTIETEIKAVLSTFKERNAQRLWQQMQEGDLERAYGSPTAMAKLIFKAIEESGKDASILDPSKTADTMEDIVNEKARELTLEKAKVGSPHSHTLFR